MSAASGEFARFEWESLNGCNAASLRPTEDGRIALSTGHCPEDQRTSTTVLLPASAVADLAEALTAWLSERVRRSVGRGRIGGSHDQDGGSGQRTADILVSDASLGIPPLREAIYEAIRQAPIPFDRDVTTAGTRKAFDMITSAVMQVMYDRIGPLHGGHFGGSGEAS